MAGKSPQPSHEPPFQAPINTDNNQKKEKKKREEGCRKQGQTVAAPKSDCLMRTESDETEKTQQRELEHKKANTLKRSWDEPCEPALERVTADQGKHTLSLWCLTL